jgi:hypothetical protein
MSKPEKPSVPGVPGEAKKTRKPRTTTVSLRLTPEQVAECADIARGLGDPEWGTTVRPMAVAARALALGLERIRGEMQ